MEKGLTKTFYSNEIGEDEVLQAYLKKISKIKPLSNEDEKYYARMAQQGDGLAKKILVQSNLKLVLNIAKKTIHTSKLPLIDLLQEGNLGLMIAVDKFNCDLGYKFSTYATWWIKQVMFKAISEQSHAMKIPVYVQETLAKYKKVKSDLEKKYNTEVKKSEVAKEMNIKEDKIDSYLNAYTQTISLETSRNENSGEKSMSFAEIIEDTKCNIEKSIEDTELKRDINSVLNFLKTKEQEVITLRFGLENNEPMTLQEIGNKYGVTKECIRQMEKRVIKKIFELPEAKKLLSCYI